MIRRPQIEKKNDLIYLKSSLAAMRRMNSREAGLIRKFVQQSRREAGHRTWPTNAVLSPVLLITVEDIMEWIQRR